MSDQDDEVVALSKIDALALAQCGQRVMMHLLKHPQPWDSLGKEEQAVWQSAAATVTNIMQLSFAEQKCPPAQSLAFHVAAALGMPPLGQLVREVQLAVEAVARLWQTLLMEDGADIEKAERFAIKWWDGKAKPVEDVNGHAKPTTAFVLPEVFVENAPMPSPQRIKTPSQPVKQLTGSHSGASQGFRKVVEGRIADLEAKIAADVETISALKGYLATIGPEHDKALWAIFSPFFKEKS